MPFYESIQRDLSYNEVLDLGVSVLEAFRCVHSIGLTYNDLKHDNIICTNDKTVIVDFGMCQHFVNRDGVHVSETSQVEKFEGNIIFATPHTLEFKVPSRRDDLYSLAYLLIYMLNSNTFPLHFEKILSQNIPKLEIV
jgi:serine/threonine protein kinase